MQIRVPMPVLLVATLLLPPLAVSAERLCCSGVAPETAVEAPVSADCCDAADEEAQARRCCSGGAERDRTQVGATMLLPPAAAVPPGRPSVAALCWSPHRRLLSTPAGPPDLPTLHAALLI